MNRGLLGFPGRRRHPGLAGFPEGLLSPRTPAVSPVGVETSTSLATTVTSNASSANQKGNWVELGRAEHDADGFFFNVSEGGTARQNFLVDIGVGGAGSETVILENFLILVDANGAGVTDVFIPIPIRGGERIAARAQARSGNSQTFVMYLVLVGGDFYRPARMRYATTYGANTADSGGVAPDPSDTASTKGDWVEIDASTARHMRCLIAAVAPAGINLSTTSREVFDIGYGPAGSETVLVPDLQGTFHASPDAVRPATFGPIPCNVPAGTRLAARSQTSVAGSGVRYDVVVIGFD